MIVIQHRVADFQAWKQAFDRDPVGRARNGVIRHVVYRSADDPNFVVVHLEFASPEQARKFLPALRELWGRATDKLGLGAGDPAGVQARLLDEVERVEY
jgi:hypothetical protein